MSDMGDNAERGYTITRVFDAPRDLVWNAWTQGDQFAQWFGGEDSHLEDVVFDARTGGSWSARMVIDGGHTIDWSGSFVEVSPPERLVMTLTDQTILSDAHEYFTVTLTEDDGRTTMVLRQHGGNLTDEGYEQAKVGTSSFIDRMEALLARQMKPRH